MVESLVPKLKFSTSDGQEVEEEKDLMMKAVLISNAIEEGGSDDVIPLPEITKATLL